MRAMSLHQPWASLVAHGLKRIETRGPRPTKRYRGPLLVHAAKKWTRKEFDALHRIYSQHVAPLNACGFGDWLAGTPPPLGAIVAVARVVDIREMTPEWIAEQTPLELAIGDWQPGRYGWVLEDVQRLEPAIALRGRQGLWEPNLAVEVSLANARRIHEAARG